MNSTAPFRSLEDIQARKAQALQELQAQKQVLAKQSKKLFAPLVPAAQKGNSLVHAFKAGMVIFDGALIGLRFIRKIRSLFVRSRY